MRAKQALPVGAGHLTPCRSVWKAVPAGSRMVRKADLMEKKMKAPLAQSDSVAAETAVELGLEIEEALDALVRTRGEARREQEFFLRALPNLP